MDSEQLSRHRLFCTGDAEEARVRMGGILRDHRLDPGPTACWTLESCATCTYVETQGSWFEDGHLRGSSREQGTGRTAEWWSKHNNWKLTPPPRR